MASTKIRFRKQKQHIDDEHPEFEFPNPAKDDIQSLGSTLAPDKTVEYRKKFDEPIGDGDQDQSSESDDVERKPKESIFIMEFQKDAQIKAIHWLIDKLRAKKSFGGAELLIYREPLTGASAEGLTIHLSASDEQLLAFADEGGFIKRTKTGLMRNFNTSCLDDFMLKDNWKMIDILTDADRQLALRGALDNIRAVEHEAFVPGYEGRIPLYHGQRIIDAMIDADIIHRFYAPHNYKKIKRIETNWWSRGGLRTVNSVRQYFGETIGIYFSFLVFYTLALAIPALIGCCILLFGAISVSVICIYSVIWTTMFLELWKRRCAEHAYNWGTISMTYLDRPRGEYKGPLGVDPITGKTCPQYPIWKTYAQMYLFSFPVVIFGAILAFYMSMSQFWAEDYLRTMFSEDSYILYLPSIVYSITVAIFSTYCEVLATWLTNLENHRTQMQFDRHLINKLVILEFVNNFVSLFYIAFWLRDLNTLQWQLMFQLTTAQLWQNFNEMIMSWLFEKYDIFCCTFMARKEKPESRGEDGWEKKLDALHIDGLSDNDSQVRQNKAERYISTYHTTYQDYLQIYIQFGYVVLFSSVVPMAALVALVNNVIEIRLDIFKLQNLYKRPFAERAKDIGSWQLAFEFLAIISIITNLAMAFMTPEIRDMRPEWTDFDWMLKFVALEHILLVVIWCIRRLIPDRPHWVRIALARGDYQSQQALKREVRSMETVKWT